MWVDCVADTVVAEQWWGTSSALVIRVPVYSGPLLISNWGTFTIGMQTLLLKRVTSRAFFSLVRHFVAFLKSFVFIPLRGGLELDLDNSSLLSHEQFSGLVSAERHPPSPTDRKFYWKAHNSSVVSEVLSSASSKSQTNHKHDDSIEKVRTHDSVESPRFASPPPSASALPLASGILLCLHGFGSDLGHHSGNALGAPHSKQSQPSDSLFGLSEWGVVDLQICNFLAKCTNPVAFTILQCQAALHDDALTLVGRAARYLLKFLYLGVTSHLGYS
ncbi:hypothetical protein Tco_1210831 [Tanacetum coccineum]